LTTDSLFKDAEFLYNEALEELARDKIRNAAEKAWAATLQATNALIFAKTGEKPENPTRARVLLDELGRVTPRITEVLKGRFHTNRDLLHGDCFYTGVCEPKDVIEQKIREVIEYIKDATKLVK